MEIDRWVVPPAVAAALFSLAAIAPPVQTSDLSRALRVEAVGAADGVLLLRVAIEHTAGGTLVAPRELTLDHAGIVHTVHGSPELDHVDVVLPTRERPGGRARVVLSAEGLRATVLVPVRRPVTAPPFQEHTHGPLAVTVAEGQLLPEVEGSVLVRAPDASEVRVEASLEGSMVSPQQAPVGPCGIATVRMRVEGMGAPVTLVARRADGVETRVHLRLPLRPGGVSLTRTGSELTVCGAFAGQTVFLAGGGARGVRWWTTLRLRAHDVCPRAVVALPAEVTWVRASTDAGFRDPDAPTLRWDVLPPAPCTDDPAARRWQEATAAVPPGPEVSVVWEGAAQARELLRRRTHRARSLAWLGLAAAIVAEAVPVLGLGLRRQTVDGTLPRTLQSLQRDDLGRLVTGVVVLVLLGFALALASMGAMAVP